MKNEEKLLKIYLFLKEEGYFPKLRMDRYEETISFSLNGDFVFLLLENNKLIIKYTGKEPSILDISVKINRIFKEN